MAQWDVNKAKWLKAQQWAQDNRSLQHEAYRVPVSSDQWFQAQKWARQNCLRLGLEYQKPFLRRFQLIKKSSEEPWKEEGALAYGAYNLQRDDTSLGDINFRDPESHCQWHASMSPDEPPRSLAKLLDTGMIMRHGESRIGERSRRQALKAVAQANPGFAEAYEEIYQILLSPPEHWKLHTGEEEYAEALERDAELIKRLAGGQRAQGAPRPSRTGRP